MRRITIALGIVSILASSCGGGDLPPRLEATLQDRVATIRGFAEAGRPGLARSALRNLVDLVIARMESGRIDGGRAIEILDAAHVVADHLALLPRPSPSDTPTPSPVEDDGGDGEGKPGKGNDNGKDKGNGGGEGNGNDGDGGDD